VEFGENQANENDGCHRITTHDGCRGIRKPKERYGKSDGGYGYTALENGVEREREPRSGEELSVS
jgi:hypothetical protein